MTDDEQLLHAYARERSEAAFGELVAWHIDFVYSTALRVVNGDSHLAQDVAQTVFIDLARKAGSLPGGVDLTGWLHRHTCYTAATAVRTERRRQSREQTAMEMRALDDNTGPEWEQVAPYLDESLNQLNPADRDALVLRFLKQQDLRAVGAALGISDDAAQKRVDRALEKLHVLLKHRGATLSAAALGTALATEAVTTAPAGLAGAVTAAALSGTTVTTTAVTAATKAIAMTTLQKAVIAATFAAAVGTGIYEARQAARARAEVQTLQQQQTPLTEQIQQLQREHDDLRSRLTALSDTNQRQNPTAELLKLRSQTGMLREQVARLKLEGQATQTPTSPPPKPAGAPQQNPHDAEFGPGTAVKVHLAANLGSIVWNYAKEHQGRFPASFDEAFTSFPSRIPEEEREQTRQAADQFEILYSGLADDMTNPPPESTLILREKQPWTDQKGRLVRVYFRGPGISYAFAPPDGDFATYENIRTQRPNTP